MVPRREGGYRWNLEFGVLRAVGLVFNFPTPTMLILLLQFLQKGYFLSFGRKIDCTSTSPLSTKSLDLIPVCLYDPAGHFPSKWEPYLTVHRKLPK